MRTRASSPRLAVATASSYPALQPDDAALLAALERLGVEPVICVWNDDRVDWAAFDAVLIRTIWDYFKHPAAFGDWLDQLDRLQVTTINHSALLRWNSDKRYLLQLAEHAVAIIPTQLARAHELRGVLADFAARQVVIKPTVSGGAWHTLCGSADDEAFLQQVALLPAHLTYLVQPFVPQILSAGEWSLLYFDGIFSHAVIKRAAAGDYRVQHEHGGTMEAAMPDANVLAAAARSLAAVAQLGYSQHAYVRVDGVVCDGRFLVMELEFIEPFLYLGMQAQAAEVFAGHVARRLAPIHRQEQAASAGVAP